MSEENLEDILRLKYKVSNVIAGSLIYLMVQSNRWAHLPPHSLLGLPLWAKKELFQTSGKTKKFTTTSLKQILIEKLFEKN